MFLWLVDTPYLPARHADTTGNPTLDLRVISTQLCQYTKCAGGVVAEMIARRSRVGFPVVFARLAGR